MHIDKCTDGGGIVFKFLKVVFRGNVRRISSGVLEIPAEQVMLVPQLQLHGGILAGGLPNKRDISDKAEK